MESITRDEVRRLLSEVAARDQRTIGVTDMLAWYQDLNFAGVTYLQASEALGYYYGTYWQAQLPSQRYRATAPILIEIIKKRRRDRLEELEFRYVPGDPDEPVDVYLARLRKQIGAVADGGPAPEPVGQLKARRMKELTSGIAMKTVVPEEVKEALGRRRHPALGVMCPKCAAPRNQMCKRGDGAPLGYRTHPSRVDVWATEVAPCPQCRAGVGDVCRDPDTQDPYRNGAHLPRVKVAESAEEAA